MKILIILFLIILNFNSFAKDRRCDEEAKAAALRAHQEAYEICAETGCEADSIEYLGKIKGVKTYKVTILDEVESVKWLVQADSKNHCTILDVASL